MDLSDILKNRTKETISNLAKLVNNDEIMDFSELYKELFFDIRPNPKNNYISDAKLLIMYVRYNFFISSLNDELKDFYRKKFRDMVYDECEDNDYELGKYVVDMKDGLPNIYDKLNDRIVPKLLIMFFNNISGEVDKRSSKNKEEISSIKEEINKLLERDEYLDLQNKLKEENSIIKTQNTLVLSKFRKQQYRINILGVLVGILIMINIILAVFF